ncbi:MAG: protein-glutamine glutaminase family protein [Vulcanimicrobiota bacterium]
MSIEAPAVQPIGRGFSNGALNSRRHLHAGHMPEDSVVLSGNRLSPELSGKSHSADSGASNAISRSSASSKWTGASAGHSESNSASDLWEKTDKRADRGCSKSRQKAFRQESPANPRFIAVMDSDLSNGIDIKAFEDRLKSDMGPKVKIQNRNDIAALPGIVPSTGELNGFFDKTVKDRSIPWDYVTDGCFARSHITCDRLLREGWNCAKIFIMADPPENDSLSDGGPDYHLRAENRYTKGEWQYHVATLVFAKDEQTGKVDGYVLDGSINNYRPLRPSQWIRSFWNQSSPIRVDTTHPDTYCSPNESDSEEPHQFFKPEFDKFLEYAVETNKKYAAALEEIKKSINVQLSGVPR